MRCSLSPPGEADFPERWSLLFDGGLRGGIIYICTQTMAFACVQASLLEHCRETQNGKARLALSKPFVVTCTTSMLQRDQKATGLTVELCRP